jgi:hypothetical protein
LIKRGAAHERRIENNIQPRHTSRASNSDDGSALANWNLASVGNVDDAIA